MMCTQSTHSMNAEKNFCKSDSMLECEIKRQTLKTHNQVQPNIEMENCARWKLHPKLNKKKPIKFFLLFFYLSSVGWSSTLSSSIPIQWSHFVYLVGLRSFIASLSLVALLLLLKLHDALVLSTWLYTLYAICQVCNAFFFSDFLFRFAFLLLHFFSSSAYSVHSWAWISCCCFCWWCSRSLCLYYWFCFHLLILIFMDMLMHFAAFVMLSWRKEEVKNQIKFPLVSINRQRRFSNWKPSRDC